ncbi:MAG: hypothetical protein QOG49_62 [Frankiaceae bacterium]|nr:hypothetical protein [Frankiaceae bacterium]
MDQPLEVTARRRFRPTDAALGRLAVGVLTALAVVSALWAVVLLPPGIKINPVLVPRIVESYLLAGPGLFFITLYGGRAARRRAGSILPGAAWLIAVALLSVGRPEGDSPYLFSSYQGLLLWPLGMAVTAAGTIRAHRTPWAAEPAPNQAFPAYADS